MTRRSCLLPASLAATASATWLLAGPTASSALLGISLAACIQAVLILAASIRGAARRAGAEAAPEPASPAPRGMHCPVCREKGPDTTFDPDDLSALPAGTNLVYQFKCLSCGRRWRWTASPGADGHASYKCERRSP